MEQVKSVAQGWVEVGRVKDAHGIRGELFITLFAGEAGWIKKLKTIHLRGPEELQLTVRSVRLHKNGLIVNSLEISDRNKAESLKGYIMDIPENFMVAPVGSQPYLREVLGYQLIDQGKAVGEVVGLGTNGAQDLLIVKTADGEREIPFVHPLIEKMDSKSRKLFSNLPLGLLHPEALENSGSSQQ